MQSKEYQKTIRVDEEINLSARIQIFGDDLLITVTGGKEHIGALSFQTLNENFTWVDPPHKEGIITEIILNKFSGLKNKRIVVVSGIHYDGISAEKINSIVRSVEKWAEKAVDKFV